MDYITWDTGAVIPYNRDGIQKETDEDCKVVLESDLIDALDMLDKIKNKLIDNELKKEVKTFLNLFKD